MRNLLTLFLLTLVTPVVLAVPISYQGQLQDQAGPFTGIADMEFQLFGSLVDDDALGDWGNGIRWWIRGSTQPGDRKLRQRFWRQRERGFGIRSHDFRR